MMQKTIKSAFLYVIMICAINFFEFQKFKGTFVKYIQFVCLFAAFIAALPLTFPKRGAFVLPVQLISFSVLFSVLISWLFWEQDLSDSIAGSVLSLVWFVFFIFKAGNFEVQRLEQAVLFYGCIYVILYFFQFTHADTGYFINPETIDFSRGITRIVFPGRGIFYLSIFIALSKLTSRSSNKLIWSTVCVLGLAVTVMQVTRQFIFATLIIYTYHFIRNVNVFKKICLIGIVALTMYALSETLEPVIAGLKDTQSQTMEQGTDYVRIRAGYFFLTRFSTSALTRVFGNGVPYGKDSKYFKYTTWCIDNHGYYLADVGIIAVYTMFGVFAVLGYLMIWKNSFLLRTPQRFYYVRYYLWFLLLTSLTSDTVFSSFDLIATVIVIYIYHEVHEKARVKIGNPPSVRRETNESFAS